MTDILSSSEANDTLNHWLGQMPVVQSCQCPTCQKMCRHPCMGTPTEMQKLIDLGYGDSLEVWHPFIQGATFWVLILRPKNVREYQPDMGYPCVFLKDGKCIVHDNKPLEGRMVDHDTDSKDNEIYDQFEKALLDTWRTKEGEALVKEYNDKNNS